MLFSYQLLKQLVPQIKTKDELIEKLSLFAFEAENVKGDAIDVKLPPNRFSDAAGHWGLAKEIAAILNFKLQIPNYKQILNSKSKIKNYKFSVKIDDKNLCSRYAGQYFENVKVGPSSKWIQKVLVSCGMRPINNIVDIMNYVMLETGQPLHAFDYDKLGANNREYQREATRNIIIRKAKKGEKITTLDNQDIELNENVLVIAQDDIKQTLENTCVNQRKSALNQHKSAILAIAGIKGGKKAEIDKNTKRIIVEAANFDATSIYKTSRSLGLITDASLRFSRGLSPELVALGLNRVAELLKKECKAKPDKIIDINFNKPSKKIIKFDVKKFVDLIGLELNFAEISKYLIRLGFKIIKDKKYNIQDSFLVEISPLRQDIETFEDLCEEVIRLYGYNNLKPKAPSVAIHPSGFEDQIVLKDKIRQVLVSLGLNEVQNNSFISQTDATEYKHPDLVELENPISAEYRYLRPCLAINFLKNIKSNSRFFEEISLFEIGNIFFQKSRIVAKQARINADNKKITEIPALGIILASKNSEVFFRLKGIVNEFFKKIGAVDFLLAPVNHDGWVKNAACGYLDLENSLKVEVESSVIGYLGRLKTLSELKGWHLSIFEIDLEKLIEYIEEEYEYQPLPKYPSIIRDVSIWVDKTARAGEMMRLIQQSNLKFIEDVDLIDEYDSESKRSLTFRVVFQARNRTLTDEEVNKMMEGIIAELQKKFKVKVR